MVDSDLRSITSDWVKYLLDPVLEDDFDFVAPIYLRHKYDGTITNNIVYNFTRGALRPAHPPAHRAETSPFPATWPNSTPSRRCGTRRVARYGIDIWMTTSAVTAGYKVCQSNLGVKVHDAKDPGTHLAPMFRQVIWTLFSLMEENESYWRDIKGSVTVPTFEHKVKVSPEDVEGKPGQHDSAVQGGLQSSSRRSGRRFSARTALSRSKSWPGWAKSVSSWTPRPG